MFGLLPAVQAMMESKQSTLREGERKLINEFLGDPQSFISGLTSLDAATVAKFEAIRDILAANQQLGRAGLDDMTLGLLDESVQRDEGYYGFNTQGMTQRDPKLQSMGTGLSEKMTGGQDFPENVPQPDPGARRNIRSSPFRGGF